MNDWRRHYDAYARLTEPDDAAVERLRTRQDWPGRVLRAHTREPRPGSVERLSRRRARTPATERWMLAGTLVVAALTALWIRGRHPSDLHERLDAESRVERALTTDVRVAYTGSGEVVGYVAAPRILWEVGTLEVEVAPGKGVALEVETGEGRVRVVGTAFAVTRGPLGTEVAVTRGEVRVTCTGAAQQALGASQAALCLPTRSGGMLGRARTLRKAGAPSGDVLAAVERGTALARPGDPALSELVALRLEVLVAEGRYQEAVEAAEAYLATGDLARRDEVRSILDQLTK